MPTTPGLIIVAAASELAAVLRGVGAAEPAGLRDFQTVHIAERWWAVRSGVGKVNAALCAERCATGRAFASVINLGVCGTLPIDSATPPALLDIVLADASVYADEGIAAPSGFTSIDAAGFGPGGTPRPGVDADFPGMGLPGDAALCSAIDAALAPRGLSARRGAIATVSTCSGIDALARDIAARTGAIAEAMEGAAIAHALARRPRTDGPPPAFAECRVVSNTTGDRHKQVWDLRGALDRLAAVAGAICSGT
jgi:futalosine hydrolase